jgi:bifunctional non-homologous end joining protein LigD
VMAKRRSSRYAPGKRSPEWLKIKRTHTVETVVGGWTEGSGNRSDSFGALLVGCYAGDRLRCVGHVGTGFEGANYAEVARLLRSIEVAECPFGEVPECNAPAHWVRPVAVCEVRHYGWTADEFLRHPVFLHWRVDKTPGDCTLPPFP